MDDLIAKINKIRDAFKTVDVPPEIQLPQFVVVGAQSAGKSSVLEAIVRRDFLPRGEDIVTRTPLELRLVYTPENDPNRKSPEDYAVFDHKKEEHFTNFNQVRDEIERKTNELAGNAKSVSDRPIILTIYSSKVVNLTLVDLPGIVKVPTKEQPKDIESKIVKLINKYIQNEKTLILVVTQATSELQTSEALKLAREVDPEGRRTLVVVTHIDRVNPGNDVVGMLAGKKIPNKLGIIGVKLRNNKEIKDNKTIDACINDETLFWQKSYQKIASKNGVPYLSKRLNELLMEHIHETLPQLRQLIRERIALTNLDLSSYEEPVDETEKNRLCTKILKEFCDMFNQALDGDTKTDELGGGARIWYSFQEIFVPTLKKIDPIEKSTAEILTAIRNNTGVYNPFFIPEETFKKLVEGSVERLKVHCLNCTEQVYDELKKTARECYEEINLKHKRFPELCYQIHEVISNLIISQREPTKKFLTQLVETGYAFINTDNPDLNNDELKKFLVDPLNNMAFFAKNGNENFLKRFGDELNCISLTEYGHSEDPLSKKRLKFTMNAEKSIARSAYSDPNNLATNDDDDTTSENDSSLSDVLSKIPVNPMPNYMLQPVENNSYAGSNGSMYERTVQSELSEKQKHDLVLTVGLISAYFFIVRKSLQDIVPKAIMKLLVNHVKSQVYEELFNQLILNENKSKENIDKLLSESDEVKKRRNEANATLKALNKANEIINEIRESDYDVPEEKEEVESIDSIRGFLADIKKFIADGAGASGTEFILWGG